MIECYDVDEDVLEIQQDREVDSRLDVLLLQKPGAAYDQDSLHELVVLEVYVVHKHKRELQVNQQQYRKRVCGSLLYPLEFGLVFQKLVD